MAADDDATDGGGSNIANAGSPVGGDDEPPDGGKPFRDPGLRTYSIYIYPIMVPCFLLTELLRSISRPPIYNF